MQELKICKKCKWYPRLSNLFTDDISICKHPSDAKQDFQTGRTIYGYCCLKNVDGNCPNYEPRRKRLNNEGGTRS